MDIYNVLYFLPVVIVLGIFGFGFYIVPDIVALDKASDNACNKIGMEYDYMQGSEVCIDSNNQAHYVRIDCNKIGWRNWDCIPRIISIGEIRTS